MKLKQANGTYICRSKTLGQSAIWHHEALSKSVQIVAGSIFKNIFLGEKQMHCSDRTII